MTYNNNIVVVVVVIDMYSLLSQWFGFVHYTCRFFVTAYFHQFFLTQVLQVG